MNVGRALSIVLLGCLVPFPALAAEEASVPADEKTVMEAGAQKTDEPAESKEEEEEEEEKSSNFYGDVSALFVNNYYWRGTYLYPENVPAFQPGVTVGYWIFDLNLWSSIPMRLRDELRDERDELDLTLTATFEVGEHLSLSAGFLTYLMTSSRPFWHTEELFIAPTYVITEEFSLTLAVFGDVDALKGVFLSLSPAWSRELTDRLTLTLAVILSCQTYRGTGLQFVEAALRADLDVWIVAGLSWTLGALGNGNVDERAFRYFLQTGFVYEW